MKIFQSNLFKLIVFIVIAVGAISGYFILKSINATVAVDQATISAPAINLTATTGGTLNQIYASEGDLLPANSIIAVVGNQLIKNKNAGELVKLNSGLGRNVNPGETIATMIDPVALQVVGQVPENKGLQNIHVGQSAYFTVDAYGSQKFYGTVTEVGSTADVGALTFNISDTRVEQNFDVKIDYDHNLYPGLKNGMSAKIWIVK
jgi:multidrug resistance efflux pump